MTLKPYKVTPTDPTLNILVFADPGVGKTQFAATAQDHEKTSDVLFANVEGGMITVASRGDITAVDLGKDEDGTPNGRVVEDLEDVIWAIMEKREGYETIRTVVVDSGSDLQAMDLENIVSAAMKNPKQKGKRSDQDEIWQEDYGKSTARLRRVFRLLRDAPVNVIVTALVKKSYPPGAANAKHEVAPNEIAPQFTAKLCESVMGYMDFVWYLYIDKKTGDRKLLTQAHGPVRAKTRGDKFAKAIGGTVENPSIPNLYDTFIAAENGKGEEA